jgi:hypothetical protein
MAQRNLSNMPNVNGADEGQPESDAANIQIIRLKPPEGFHSYAGSQSYKFRDKKASIFEAYRYKHWGAKEKYRKRKRATDSFDQSPQPVSCASSRGTVAVSQVLIDSGGDMDVDEINNPQKINDYYVEDNVSVMIEGKYM